MATVLSVKIVDRKTNITTGKRSAVDTYIVTFDQAGSVPNGNDFRNASAGGTTMPRRGDFYDATDTALRCRNIDGGIKEPPAWWVWQGDVTYETGDVGDENEDPLQEPPLVEWGDQTTSEPVYRDKDGNAVVNSAREVFDPPLNDDIFDGLVNIQRNILQYDEVIAESYRGRINSVPFRIKGASSPILPGCAKVISYTGATATKNGVAYWVERIAIGTRIDGFKRRVLDRGFSTLDPLTQKPKVITDDQRYSYPEGVLLNGAGQLLPPGAPAVFLQFELGKEPADFNGMNLPTV